MRKVLLLSLLVAVAGISAFMSKSREDQPVYVPASKQRTGGDAKKGFEYLVNGDYVKSGIPYNAFLFGTGFSSSNYLVREGLNKNISHEFTAITSPNGEVLVAPNCLQCHAQVFQDRLIVGLGNSMTDYTKNEKFNVANIILLEKILKANAPKQYEASSTFLSITKLITPYLYTSSRGVNMADRLAGTLVAHRDPVTFQWNDQPQLLIPEQVIPSDTPPWWLLKKKNAMFYNGFGRGDFGKFLMASNLLTVKDTAESRSVDEHMPDVLAYIFSIPSPKYAGKIDQDLATKGNSLFLKNCASCHGTYGSNESYPNLLIPSSIIQTDSFLYKNNYSNPQFIDWFNKSWFTKGNHPATLVPYEGYMAPPLDGIWISAPYLHNGSVPSLETLLNSKARPQFWTRDFDHPQYDDEHVGWKFKTETSQVSSSTYNTNLPGYGNGGHYFGDVMTKEERIAIIEYLKTL